MGREVTPSASCAISVCLMAYIRHMAARLLLTLGPLGSHVGIARPIMASIVDFNGVIGGTRLTTAGIIGLWVIGRVDFTLVGFTSRFGHRSHRVVGISA